MSFARLTLSASAASVLALSLGVGLGMGLHACGGAPPDSPAAAQPPADQTAANAADPNAEAGPGEGEEEEELVVEDDDESDEGVDAEIEVDPYAPLTDEQKAVFLAGETEEWISTEEHYIKTNERRHDVWFPYIADKGGAYVGVAADQNYTLIAVAKSEYVFLMDLDWRVAELHRAYEVLIEASEDPQTLHQRWHKDNKDESYALIENALKDELSPEHLRKTMMSWTSARETVYRHLKNVIARDEGGVNTSWLSNPEYYAHIRELYLADRVRFLVGNLTGPTTVQTIAKVSGDLGVPVKLLYLSNAEEYYSYTGQYRENIRALPIADDSVVLRTIYGDKFVHADSLWNYQVQPLADYQARLEDRALGGSRNPMMRIAEKAGELQRDAEGVKGLSHLNMAMLDGAAEAAPEVADPG